MLPQPPQPSDAADFAQLEAKTLAVHDLCGESEFIARKNLEYGEPIAARDGLLDSMTMVRNLTRRLPFRYVKTMELMLEPGLLRGMAAVAASLPRDEAAQLSDLMGQLPAAISPGQTLLGEPKFHAMQFARRALPPAQLQEALDSFSLFCTSAAKEIDLEPALSQEEFEPHVAELAKNFSPNAPRLARTLAEISVKAICHFHSLVCDHREWTAMFHCGLAIIREGPSAVQRSLESHGNGSFSYVPADHGFAIQAKTISPCTGKPIGMRFGKAVRNQT
jgi:hypothetical protein